MGNRIGYGARARAHHAVEMIRQESPKAIEEGPALRRWRAPLLIGLGILQFALTMVVAFGGFEPNIILVAVIVMLAPLAILCELGITNLRWKYTLVEMFSSQPFKNFFFGPIFLLLPLNATHAGLFRPPPSWFPTPHSIWIVVPLLVFFAADWLLGWSDIGERMSPRARLAETFRADGSRRHYVRLALFIALGVLQLAVALAAIYREGGLDAGFLSLVVIGSLIAVLVFCEAGLSHLGVFDPDNQGAALFFVPVPLFLTPLILTSPAPNWYPTADSAWILGAWALFFCAVVIVEYRYWDAKGRR